MDKLQEILQGTYDRIAPTFAETNAAMPPSVLEAANFIISILPASARILDTGCGHGREIAWFTARGYEVYGLDLSTGMLEQTKILTKAPLVQATMLRLPFKQGTFDALWCDAAMLHIPKQQAPDCLLGFKRLLKSGGLLFLALKQGSGEVWFEESYGHEAPRFFALYHLDEFTDILQSAGFQVLYKSEMGQTPRTRWLHFIARR